MQNASTKKPVADVQHVGKIQTSATAKAPTPSTIGCGNPLGCRATQVGYWSWLPLTHLAAERRDWTPLAPGVTGFEHRLAIPQWGLDAQEKTIAELKDEFALDVVPTNHYGANSAWQQLSVLAHNFIRSFQLDTGAEPKRGPRKRTYAFLFRSMRTLRFLVIARAGRVVRIGGRTRLRLAQNPRVQQLYEGLEHALAAVR